jgi:hypothetical protein
VQSPGLTETGDQGQVKRGKLGRDLGRGQVYIGIDVDSPEADRRISAYRANANSPRTFQMTAYIGKP